VIKSLPAVAAVVRKSFDDDRLNSAGLEKQIPAFERKELSSLTQSLKLLKSPNRRLRMKAINYAIGAAGRTVLRRNGTYNSRSKASDQEVIERSTMGFIRS